MSEKTMKENLQSFAVKKVLHYMDEDPDKSLPKLLDWADKFDKDNLFAGQRKVFHNILENPGNNWYRLIKSLWSDIDPEVRKTFFENFIVNTSLIGSGRQDKCKEEHNCNIPWAILMDPTSACNLHCTGCWAAEYGNKLNMSYETLDDIIRQGKEMGTFMYIFSGGEPLVRKDDIIRLCEAHPDCMFLAFTNGTLIDEKFADEMLRVKNFVPAISIEGFEEATDSRRGNGTYQSVMRAMDILREKKLIFGASCCYTSQNIDSLSSEEYIDHLIAKGAKFAWFFHYMPVGNDAVPELLPSPLFMAYHDGQPFNENMLRSCPMLENPECLRSMVQRSGAHSTDMQSPEDVENLYGKCKPYAENWVETADTLWGCSHSCAGCHSCEK